MREGMISDQFVTARAEHQHGANRGNATAEISDEVERRIVRPMHILENEYRRSFCLLKRIQERGKKSLGSGRLIEQCGDLR